MVEQKEIEEFLIRFAGAMAGGFEDAAFEGYYKAAVDPERPFPYTQLHPDLPVCDDLIVGGLAIPPWVIGALLEEDGKKRGDVKARELGKNLKMFGEGNVIYAANMLLYEIGYRLPEPEWTRLQKRVAARRTSPPRRTDVGHRIVKL